jgi:hypothetical protein
VRRAEYRTSPAVFILTTLSVVVNTSFMSRMRLSHSWHSCAHCADQRGQMGHTLGEQLRFFVRTHHADTAIIRACVSYLLDGILRGLPPLAVDPMARILLSDRV